MTNRLTLKHTFVQQYKNGFPLIKKEALNNPNTDIQEGSIIHLHSDKKEFIAKGYVGYQNKGLGWVLTQNQNDTIDAAFFKNKLARAIGHRNTFYQNPATTAFRVFNGEGDGIGGLTIDYFSGYYLINWYSEGIYMFKEAIVKALEQLVDYKGIYEKKRFDKKGKYIDDDDFVKGERGEFPIIVQENNMNYAVDLNEGAMVGVFLDQREVRRAIRDQYAEGKEVLNTFSYTGAFSVAALHGNASKTTSVDLAKRSKPKTIEQFSVNGFDFEAQDIVVMDVFDYFKYAKRKNLTFDMVILDPPSFARSKKRTFSAAKDYTGLMAEAIHLTRKNGIIVASTNNATFNMKKFRSFIHKAFENTSTEYKVLNEFSLPDDFKVNKQYPAGNYLKVLVVQKSE
ncbi:23S rRNA (cytosine(1962)-C(5))-methyltransferase [Lentibacillus sp. JNUCC-1]|uniref:class I SAM-dependent rRNA methyltransferase n=1 Tax=Lentibacillus sp. JNUCC-1 TaxID=2654513 RepID=UPI0012E883E7|nr:class I SAM-dependent rRNA methyltransferase [Lentibacillus sp. JNUCC-1]MUV36484.1 23S rRNA (cytosine(1962)-C(5))-methyltransferase [Lentibacillus sp. JNUCC-1]